MRCYTKWLDTGTSTARMLKREHSSRTEVGKLSDTSRRGPKCHFTELLNNGGNVSDLELPKYVHDMLNVDPLI